MKHLIDIKRLFSTYDKSNRSKTYIITKTIVLFLGLSVCAELVIAVCYFLLPSCMTNLVRTTAESLTINGVKSFSLKAWVWVIIIAPMMEETTHRLWLSMKKTHVAVSVAFGLYYVLGFIMVNYVQNHVVGAISCGVVSVFAGMMFYSLVSEDALEKIKCNSLLYPILVLLGCMAFSLAHLTNYAINVHVLLFGVVSCFRQLAGGISLSYLRINLGFFYAVLFHCSINLVACLLATL